MIVWLYKEVCNGEVLKMGNFWNSTKRSVVGFTEKPNVIPVAKTKVAAGKGVEGLNKLVNKAISDLSSYNLNVINSEYSDEMSELAGSLNHLSELVEDTIKSLKLERY